MKVYRLALTNLRHQYIIVSIGRILGIILGIILFVAYNDPWIKLIGILEIVSCSYLYMYKRNKDFKITKIIVLLVYVPILLNRGALLPAILLTIWDTLTLL